MSYAIHHAPGITHLRDGPDPQALDQSRKQMLETKPRGLDGALCYDDKGGEYFAQLCEQPEYYPAHVEFRLLRKEAENIVKFVSPSDIVDLGAGYMQKTQILVHEMIKHFGKAYISPCDIDVNAMMAGIERINKLYNKLVDWNPINGSFQNCFPHLERIGPRRLYTMLGLTYGNMSAEERSQLMNILHHYMRLNDYILLAIDLDKDRRILEQAYQDSQGFSAKNALRALPNYNRIYGANFEVQNFEYYVEFDSQRSSIVEYVKSLEDQRVNIPGLSSSIYLDKGEFIEIGFSQKFRLEDIVSEFISFSFIPVRVICDRDVPYALILLQCQSHEYVADDRNPAETHRIEGV